MSDTIVYSLDDLKIKKKKDLSLYFPSLTNENFGNYSCLRDTRLVSYRQYENVKPYTSSTPPPCFPVLDPLLPSPTSTPTTAPRPHAGFLSGRGR